VAYGNALTDHDSSPILAGTTLEIDPTTAVAVDDSSTVGSTATAPDPVVSGGSWKVSTLVIVAYVLLGVAAFWPVLPWTSDRLVGGGGDSILATWFLAWVPHSLAHGMNPLFSNAILAPHGVNLAQNTEAPLLGLLTTPFALFLGPVARFNLLIVLAMPASATAAYIVLRKWKVWWAGAAIGGLLFGFSPYVIGQSPGHVVLIFLPLLPFIALAVSSILRRTGTPWRTGLLLGLLVTAQFLIEPELTATVALLTGWAVLWVAVRHRSQIAQFARPIVTSFAVAIGVAVVLLSYPIWMMFGGPQHYTGTAQALDNGYYVDIMNFIATGPYQRVSMGVHFAGVPLSNASEAGGYIGIPVLIVAGLLIWRSRRSPRMQLAVVVFLGAAILSLGPHLSIDGRSTGIPLPFDLLRHLPLLDNILPDRISMESAACMGAIIAFGLDDVRRELARRHRHSHVVGAIQLAAVPLIVLAVVAITQLPAWPISSQPARPLPRAIADAIPAGDPMTVTYPVASPVFTRPMTWQVDSGFRFRLVGGYAEHPDPTGKPTGMPDPLEPEGLDNFLDGQEGYNPYLAPVPLTPGLVSTLRDVAGRNDIRLIIVDRSVKGSGLVLNAFSQAFGAPQVATSRYALWARADRPL